MVCIYCQSPTTVTNSRHQRKQNNIWRRRLCVVCGGIFTTHEKPDLTGSVMVESKMKDELLPFSRENLFVSIYEACRHRPRAVYEATELTNTIIAKVLPAAEKGIIQIGVITKTAKDILSRFDKDASTIYAAYHATSGANRT